MVVDMQRFIIVFIAYNILFFLYRIFFKKEKSDLLLLFPLVVLFAVNINFFGFRYVIVGEQLSYTINSLVVYILLLFLYSINRNLKFDLLYLYFIIKLGYGCLQIASPSIFFNYPKFFIMYITDLTLFLLFFAIHNFKNINVDKIIYNINYLALFHGILSIIQFITKKSFLLTNWDGNLLYTEGVVDTFRTFGLAGSNNAAGNFGALLFIVIFFNFKRRGDLFSRLCLFLTIIATALSQTRIGIIGIIVGVVTYAILNIFKERKIKLSYNKVYLFLASFFVILLFFYISYDEIYQQLFLNRGDTASSRFIQFERVFNYALQNHINFGIGLGQWRTYLYYSYSIVDLYIHSHYLSILAEQGILIFSLFVFANFYLLFKIVKKSSLDIFYKFLATCLFVVNIVCSNFNPNQLYFVNVITYYYIMFALYSYSCKKD